MSLFSVDHCTDRVGGKTGPGVPSLRHHSPQLRHLILIRHAKVDPLRGKHGAFPKTSNLPKAAEASPASHAIT